MSGQLHQNTTVVLVHAAWAEKPSWYLLAEKDRMISPVTQRFMAERMKARIHSHAVDHTPLASTPESVVQLIEEAVAGSV